MKTKQTEQEKTAKQSTGVWSRKGASFQEEPIGRDAIYRLASRISRIEEKIEDAASAANQALMVCRQAHEKVTALEAEKPIKGQPHGAALEVDSETKRHLEAQAQFLKLHSADELAQIVLHAFIEMCDDEPWIKFPLMLQQVETA